MDESDFPPRAMHTGELTVQRKRGVAQEAAETNYMVQPFLAPFSDAFFRSTRFVVIGTIDSEKRVWAHVAYGQPGFYRARSATQVQLAPDDASVNALLSTHLSIGTPVATIVVDLETRKRFRVNGKVTLREGNKWLIDVAEAYPNCPKKRVAQLVSAPTSSPTSGVESSTVSAHLTEEWVTQIANADTFYIATYHPDAGVDISHRGGKPGFVRVISDREIMWPDYKGNNLFMTLGNLLVNPTCGLIFVHPETGAAIQLTGKAELLWDDKLSLDLSPASVHFRISSVRYTPNYSPLRWQLIQPSPFNPPLQGPPFNW